MQDPTTQNTPESSKIIAGPGISAEPDNALTLRQIELYLDRLSFLIRHCTRYYLRGLKQLKGLMIALGVFLFGLSIYLVYHAPSQYEGTASFTYNSLHKKLYGEMTDKLNNLLLAGDYNTLANLLSISIQQARSIRAIKATNIYHSLLSEDMAENEKLRIFYVYFAFTTPGKGAFNHLGTGLETYYNDNAAVRELTSRRQAEILPGIQYRYTELGMLDSLIRSYTASLSHRVATAYPLPATAPNTPLDPLLLLKKGEDITLELADMHLYLKDHRVVKLQDDFLTGAPKTGFSLKKGALLVAGGFLVFSSLIILIASCIKTKSYAA